MLEGGVSGAPGHPEIGPRGPGGVLGDQEADGRGDLLGLPGPAQQTAQRLGIQDRVTFHGRVEEAELRASYGRADVFAIASIAELQSIATMEAMASGLPVVAANAVALPHLVHDGENGYLFEPGNVDDLADKLRRVLTASPEEYLRMQQASLDGVEIHDIEKTLDTFEKLYRGEPLDA